MAGCVCVCARVVQADEITKIETFKVDVHLGLAVEELSQQSAPSTAFVCCSTALESSALILAVALLHVIVWLFCPYPLQ